MFEVTVSGWFAAAHQLRLAGGSYEPLHGHNWQVRVTYTGGELDESGLLVDFVVARRRLNQVLAGLHDRLLNQLPEFEHRNPSAENIAVLIAEQMRTGSPGVPPRCVEVEEEPGCVARYYPGRKPAEDCP